MMTERFMGRGAKGVDEEPSEAKIARAYQGGLRCH
jgi:hypothetical protein